MKRFTLWTTPQSMSHVPKRFHHSIPIPSPTMIHSNSTGSTAKTRHTPPSRSSGGWDIFAGEHSLRHSVVMCTSKSDQAAADGRIRLESTEFTRSFRPRRALEVYPLHKKPSTREGPHPGSHRAVTAAIGNALRNFAKEPDRLDRILGDKGLWDLINKSLRHHNRRDR